MGRQLLFSTKPHLSVGGQVLSLLAKYYYIDGSCEIELPPGIYNFEISKGERFYTLSSAIEIKLGQAALRFIIDRKSNSPWNNWISGDARCHNLSNAAAVLEGAAEGLDIVHLLAFEKIQSENSLADISKVLDFSG